MSRYLSSRFLGIEPYVPGEQPQNRQYIKLNTNESPFPPAPGVFEAISREEIQRLNLYPDPDTRETADIIAGHFGLQRANVLLGNGSDELLSFCFQAFCGADTPACFPDISYGFYKVFARILCIPTHIYPLGNNLNIVPADYCPAEGTVFLANPNAPTGQALALDEIELILKSNPDHVVILDEAYVDFGAESAYSLIDRYDNLIVIQTMSKSRNLAGARIGYALACEELISDLNSMKFSFNPYNLNRLSLLAGAAAIQDTAYFTNCIGKIQEIRAFTVEELEKRGFTVLPSLANFIFAQPERMNGESYYLRLKEKGVLVRHFTQKRITGYVRITIGTKEQMQALLNATDELWKEAI
ncbi:MAG: histidinol-phosphate transaminase [Flexilinea sp.]